jgi:hypothetical protein
MLAKGSTIHRYYIFYRSVHRLSQLGAAPTICHTPPPLLDGLRRRLIKDEEKKRRKNVIMIIHEVIVKEKLKQNSTIAGHYLQSASKPNVSSLVVFGI